MSLPTQRDLEKIRETTDRAELDHLIQEIQGDLSPLNQEQEVLMRKIRPLQDALFTATTRRAELG